MSSLPELKEVVHALDPMADKYFEVGVQLGLKPELLRRIEGEHTSHTRRLCETIHSWQRNNSSERCTWSTLADAVAKVGGHDNLVRELEKRANNAPVSRQPCGESEDSASDTGYSEKNDWKSSSGSETATEKPCAVAKIEGQDDLDSVDQGGLNVWPARLRGNNLHVPPLPSESGAEDTGYSTKSVSPISDTESSSGSDIERFELMPGCGCGKEKPCSLYTLCARGCPNPTRRRIPVLQKKRVCAVSQDYLPSEKEDDCEEYEAKTEQIQKRFGKFIKDTCCSFKERKVDIETLTLYLQSSFPVMKTRSKELDEATSMEQVFKIVVDQACSWFNYNVIVSTIQEFGESSDKDRADVYKEEFKKYAEQRLPKGKKHIEIGSGAKVGGMQLVVKIDKEWEEVNFNELDKLRGSFASILGVRRRDLYLADVREGCIMMTFMIQEELAKKLFPTKTCLTAEQIHSLKSESVISVRCGKLSWRSSVVASNKTESSAGPIEPQTWGASTTANDVSDAVTDIKAVTPFPLVADEMHPPVLYRTPAMASNRIIPIHGSEALDYQKLYRSEDGPPVHKEDELCEVRLMELDQKLKLYCSQERGEIAEVLQPLAYKYFEDGVQLDVSVDTLHAITKDNPTISRRLCITNHCETNHSSQNNSSADSCTWSTLADSIARVGGHDNLGNKFRKRENNDVYFSKSCGKE